ARDVTRTVLDGRQFLRVLARTGLIALGRHSHGQGFVGPLLIVHIAPAIEAVLGLREILELSAAQHLGLERAMESFLLALGLGMALASMGHPDLQADEPDFEVGVSLLARCAPRRAVVRQQCLRQAVATEQGTEVFAYRGALLVPAGAQRQAVT